MAGETYAIIGAGFSGTLLALHLLRRAPPGARIVLIERHRQFGRGQAYAEGNPSHLLNVPAGRMSAFHDQPGHFCEWLAGQDEAELGGAEATPSSFVPRRLFGAYVRDLLNDELKRRDPRDRLELVRGDACAVERDGERLTVRLDRDRSVPADRVVLAVGNFPPAPPPVADASFYDSPLYRPDPWSPDAVAGLYPDCPVLLIGSGLTMVDQVISLLDQGHVGPIRALSRRGRLPLRHATAHAPRPPHALPPLPGRLADLMRMLRAEARREMADGGDWRPVLDALRPHTAGLWQAMGSSDRARFLRHLRPWWDIHRHRMAPEAADRVEAALASGQLTIHAGRIDSYAADGDEVEVLYRARGCGTPRTLRAARVVNCSGPGTDFERIQHPLVAQLLRDGAARPDPLRLGLDVREDCAVLDAQSRASERLFAIGPATKGAFWEMTAVPDLRRQAEQLAGRLTEAAAV
jgi:uncharacterized NAD(P)/FAD-binding protein YdhS